MKKLSLALLLVLLMVLTACQSGETTPLSTKTTEPTETSNGPYTVIDDRGEEITFDKVPETVVSLQPCNTEILFSLGVGNRIIGATDFDIYPEEAKKIERVSDSVNINAERIIALHPDVVIAYTVGDVSSIEPLVQSGIPVFVIKSASTFDDVYGDIRQIAEVMGLKDKGDEVVSGIQHQLDEVDGKLASVAAKKSVYLEVSPAPDIYTTGNHTFQQEILSRAGVENIFADQEGWVQASSETIIERNPDVIFSTSDYAAGADQEIKSRDGWETIQAVQSGNVYVVSSEVTTRPGPRIAEAVQLIAERAYPDRFK